MDEKTIFIFDLGGVLIRLNVGRSMRAFEALMGERNMHQILGMDNRGEGVKAVSVASKQLMADFERGLISTDRFIDEVLHYCRPGTTAQEVIDAWMAMLDELPKERLDFVDALRAKGHKTYLLSNGNDLHFDFINATYGLDTHFDALFLSQRMHMSKPEYAIYEAVQTAIGGENNEIVFIDDIETNRLAAERAVHWHTFPSIEALKAQKEN